MKKYLVTFLLLDLSRVGAADHKKQLKK